MSNNQYPFKNTQIKTRKNFNIILDLDQTLIAGEVLEELESQIKSKSEKEQLMEEIDEYGNKYGSHTFTSKDGDSYLIFGRPYLQEFLDVLFLNFNVSVWTAASHDYAMFVINKFILEPNPSRKLDFIFTRNNCELLEDKHGKFLTKPLTRLFNDGSNFYNKNNTFILDDNPDVFKIQKENCIKIQPFELFHKKTNYKGNSLYMKKYMRYLKKELDCQLALIASTIFKFHKNNIK